MKVFVCRCLYHRAARGVLIAAAALIHLLEPLGIPHGLEQSILGLIPVQE